METAIIIIFILGYLAIAFEHSLKIDKLVPALVMMALIWAIISFFGLTVYDIDPATKSLVPNKLEKVINYFLGHTAEILIFLIGAMTIVEIIDFFNGFSTIKNLIKTKSKIKILWIICFLAFFLSAIIDNLTATIVLITILQKILKDRNLKLWYAGMIIVAANAGGAWSPIGDITTTMLWIGKKVTPIALLKYLIIPSLVCMLIPTYVVSRYKVFQGEINPMVSKESENKFGSKILIIGLLSILFVPFFKVATGLPPYVGMMLSLAFVATIGEIYNYMLLEPANSVHHSPVHHALTKIEMPSILFFLGILMAVGGLEALGIVFEVGQTMVLTFENVDWFLFKGLDIVVFILGFLSAAIDNVPLVAASMGMFGEAVDDPLWHGIAYAAGTGGSMIIIGSAAGVVAMGMEKIDFIWYLKKIAFLAFIGYIAGFLTFIFLRDFVL
ncbi:MAG: sodium:proton antiporter [Flavobacteriales bacterium]|jgi:Na+/H+ antiporter NhaD/arsenite permease-like protein|nr:sodium:proton antiporter [Flavobacteriales bacterium]|tara:strand:+ start:10 stop:1335 length:1326 start_codon:yes stop_codon:yes gene_type:complete